MISRRTFIKALGWLALGTAGGTALWRVWRDRPQQPSSAEWPGRDGAVPLLSLFLLSDIHMSSSNSAMGDKLHTALKDITSLGMPLNALVLGGDLVDGGRASDYEGLRKILAGYELPPVHANMGNHEYYHIWYDERGEWTTDTGHHGTDAESRERFMQFMGYDRPYHDAWVNGVHLIMLSQEAYVQERPDVGEGAWYSDEQMAWLRETMAAHADGRPALVFIHQPLPPAGEDGGQHRVIRAREFREILAPYRNVFVLSGHTHRSLETEGRYVRDSTFHWFSNASVGKTRGNASVPNPVQGLYIQVYEDQVLLVGREFSNGSWIEAAQWTVALT